MQSCGHWNQSKIQAFGSGQLKRCKVVQQHRSRVEENLAKLFWIRLVHTFESRQLAHSSRIGEAESPKATNEINGSNALEAARASSADNAQDQLSSDPHLLETEARAGSKQSEDISAQPEASAFSRNGAGKMVAPDHSQNGSTDTDSDGIHERPSDSGKDHPEIETQRELQHTFSAGDSSIGSKLGSGAEVSEQDPLGETDCDDAAMPQRSNDSDEDFLSQYPLSVRGMETDDRLYLSKARNKLIMGAKSSEEILQRWSRSGQNWSAVNVSSAFYKIGRLLKGLKKARKEELRRDLRLKALAEEVDARVHYMDGTSLRTLAFTHQRTRLGSDQLPELLLDRLEVSMGNLRRGELSGTLLSLLAMNQITPETLQRLTSGVIQWLSKRIARHWPNMEQIMLRDIADLLWSYAVLGMSDANVLVMTAKLTKATFSNARDSDKDLINISRVAYCFSKLKHVDKDLYDGLTRQALSCLQTSAITMSQRERPSDYIRLAWSLAQAYSVLATDGQSASELAWNNSLGVNSQLRRDFIASVPYRAEVFELLLGKIQAKMEELTWIDNQMLLQALAFVNMYDKSLLASIDEWILSNHTELNIQSVATIMWSHAVLGHDNPEVFETLARQTREMLKAGTVTINEELANAVMIASGKLGIKNLPECRKLVAASARWLIRNERDINTHRNIPLVLQSLAQVEIMAEDYLIQAYTTIARHEFSWDVNKARLYEADVIFSIVQPGWLPFSELSSRPLELRLSSQDTWFRYQREAFALIKETASEIARLAQELGYTPQLLAHWNGYILDVSFPSQAVAIQVLAASSVANNTSRPLGMKRAKQTMLEMENWHVVNIVEAEWTSLGTDKDRLDFLRQQLQATSLSRQLKDIDLVAKV